MEICHIMSRLSYSTEIGCLLVASDEKQRPWPRRTDNSPANQTDTDIAEKEFCNLQLTHEAYGRTGKFIAARSRC